MLKEIKMHFGTAGSLYRIMLINIVFFLLLNLVNLFLFLFHINDYYLNLIVSKLSLPSSLQLLASQPWSLFTYMFIHQEIMHILFNMLILYWTGKLFIEYLGNDKLWATYLLGGFTGGILYVLAFNFFPVFAGVGESARLLGASAGVLSILVAIATLLPDYSVMLLFFGAVRLKYIAIISILLYAISIPSGNAGGNIAHLGGALFGFIMIRQLKNGNDLTGWLVNLSDRLKGKRKSKMTVVGGRLHGNQSRSRENQKGKTSNQEIIDGILDKINRSGFDSLSSEEKEILYKASGKRES